MNTTDQFKESASRLAKSAKDTAQAGAEVIQQKTAAGKEQMAEEKAKVQDALKDVSRNFLDHSADAAEFIAKKARKASDKLL